MSLDSLMGGGANSSMKNAKNDLKNDESYLKSAGASYDDLRAKGDSMWSDYATKYAPVENQALAQAKAGVAPDYAGITNMGGAAAEGVGNQYDLARAAASRDAARRGLSSDSPEFSSMMLSSRLGEAGAKAGAFTRGNVDEAAARANERKYADTTTFNRRAGMTAVGRGLQQSAMQANAQQAAGRLGIAGGFDKAAGTNVDIAKPQADASSQLMQTAGTLAAMYFMA